jgi:hypothetical protein
MLRQLKSSTAAAFTTNATEEKTRDHSGRRTDKSSLSRTGQATIAPRVRIGNHLHETRRNTGPSPRRISSRTTTTSNARLYPQTILHSVQPTGQPLPLPGCSPGATAGIVRDVLAPSTHSLRSGYGPSALDVAALVANRRLRPGELGAVSNSGQADDLDKRQNPISMRVL